MALAGVCMPLHPVTTDLVPTFAAAISGLRLVEGEDAGSTVLPTADVGAVVRTIAENPAAAAGAGGLLVVAVAAPCTHLPAASRSRSDSAWPSSSPCSHPRGGAASSNPTRRLPTCPCPRRCPTSRWFDPGRTGCRMAAPIPGIAPRPGHGPSGAW